MRDLLEAAGMADAVAVASAGSRDYNVGDGPDPLLVAVAEELQLRCAVEITTGSFLLIRNTNSTCVRWNKYNKPVFILVQSKAFIFWKSNKAAQQAAQGTRHGSWYLQQSTACTQYSLYISQTSRLT